MNCRPGDMAVVVKGTNLGLIVTVVGVSESYGEPYWRVHPAWPVRARFPDGSWAIVTVASIHDARLRPIRPPPPQQTLVLPAAVPAEAS